jgi:hypothetical protein
MQHPTSESEGHWGISKSTSTPSNLSENDQTSKEFGPEGGVQECQDSQILGRYRSELLLSRNEYTVADRAPGYWNVIWSPHGNQRDQSLPSKPRWRWMSHYQPSDPDNKSRQVEEMIEMTARSRSGLKARTNPVTHKGRLDDILVYLYWSNWPQKPSEMARELALAITS